MRKNNFSNFLAKHNSFLILSHESADADSVGSTMAMALYLEKLGKNVGVLPDKKLHTKLQFLVHERFLVNLDKINNSEGSFDALIVLDSSNIERTVLPLESALWQLPILNIDHHGDNTFFGEVNIFDEDAAATCEILATIIPEKALDDKIAMQLYAGIVGDTGCFRHSNTTPGVLRLAADLQEYDFDRNEVIRLVILHVEEDAFRMLADALRYVKFLPGFIYLALPNDVLERYNLDEANHPDFVSYLTNVGDAKVVAVMKEIEKNIIKISLRGCFGVNVRVIAQHFGGGGHILAAGAKVEGDFDIVVKEMEQYVKKYLRELGGEF